LNNENLNLIKKDPDNVKVDTNLREKHKIHEFKKERGLVIYDDD
jgi:hypothetical protein